MKNLIIITALVTAAPHAAFGQPEPEPSPPPPPPVETTATTEATETSPDDWSFGIAPRLAVTVPTSKLGAMVVGGLEIDFALPVAERRLIVALDVTMTRPSYDGSGSDPRVGGAYEYTVKETEVKIGLDAIFRIFTADKKFVPYVGAGPLIHLLRTTETTSFTPDANMEESTKLGFEVLVGADYRVGPGMLLGELRVVYSDLDHLFTGDSNAGNLMIGVGYRFVF